MNYLIIDDSNIKKHIPFALFIMLWEIVIAYVAFAERIIKSLLGISQLAVMMLLPLMIFVIINRNVCKIIYNSKERRFVISYSYKEVIINEIDVDRLEIINGKEFVGDYGMSCYEVFSIIGISGEELFRYRTNKMETPDGLIENLKGKLVCGREII